jgi:peptidoglycan hydrolase CwlO-like protein
MSVIKGKGFLPLLAIIIVSFLISASIFILFQGEKSKNKRLSETIADLQTKNTSLQAQLDEAMNKVADLQKSVSEAQQKITDLSADIQKERQQKEESSSQLSQLKQELEQQKTLKAELEKKLADSQDTFKALDEKIKEMETQLKDAEAVKVALEGKLKNYEDKQNVELGKIVVNPDGTSTPVASAAAVMAPAKDLAGAILVINKDYNFAVINLGSKDGIAVGNIFTVFHNNKPVAELKIEKVHEAMSAAGFAPDTKGKIVEGDKVELKSK